jgi:hypothetical protein|tara:strand:- start:556 stop:1080 length:525 start_codon:yes stop_codon:yes gene_type:complete
MACTLTTGRKVPCKSAVGGLKTVYFADYGTLGAATIVGGEVTALAGSPALFQFDIKGNSSLETAVNSSRENGTTFYESTLNITLTFLEKATQEELKLIAHARPHVFVEDYNGNYFVMGLEHGAEVTGGSIVSGAAMGDLSGFTLTLVAQETAPPYFITGSVVTGDASATQITPN